MGFTLHFINTGTWKGAQLKPSIDSVEGANSGAYFTFDLSGSRTINYKFGISYVSKENARENLQKENPGFHFEQVAANATNLWNKYLSKIEVSGGNSQHTTLFYTSLYHALLHPSVFNDVNGQYVGSDGEVYVAKDFNYYTAFSNWDTYRTQIQLLSVLEPDKASDIVRSLILFAQRGGGSFPRWVVANYETGIMQGDPTSIIVSNGYAFGARDFDHDLALTIMRRGAEQPDARCQSTLTRPHLKEYLEKGYLSDASMLLEYTSADFAIGQFALQAFNDTSLFNKYLLRAQYWKNIYNPDTRWLNSRNEDGSWRAYYEGWREGSYKNYFWMVPYSLKSLIDTIGGLTAAQQRLDSLFIRLDALFYFDPKQNPTWFSMGNQPDFGAPWVYNWAGAPFKTQEVVRRIIETQYHNKLDGLPGNEDMGAMGSWYVFANLGLYPEIPGVAGFSINSPAFPYIKIHLPKGELEITGGSEDKYYIETLELNGHNYDQTWLPWTKIVKGAKLKFKLSEYPDKKWGLGKPPPSFGGEVRPPLFAEPRKPV